MARTLEGIKYELARAGFNPSGMSRTTLRALARLNRQIKAGRRRVRPSVPTALPPVQRQPQGFVSRMLNMARLLFRRKAR